MQKIRTNEFSRVEIRINEKNVYIILIWHERIA